MNLTIDLSEQDAAALALDEEGRPQGRA